MRYLLGLVFLIGCSNTNEHRDKIIQKAECFCKEHNSYVLSIHFYMNDKNYIGDISCANNMKVTLSAGDYLVGCHK